MNRWLWGCLIVCLSLLWWGMPAAQAEGSLSGPPDRLFEIHCAGCHPNGSNIIRRGKNLKQRALQRNGYGDADAIAALITDGKGNMSAYGDKLSPDEIAALAQYILDRATANWK
jgi:cytochrome c6